MKVRYLHASRTDPDRQEALKVVNFLAGRSAREAMAILSLAATMSLRNLSHDDYRRAIDAICQACLMSWLPPEVDDVGDCLNCDGAGTVADSKSGVGADPATQGLCPQCGGAGWQPKD